jgi:DNA-binding transcriptional LysR family regulator
MQKLEAELGASLLIRTTRRLSLTDAGEAFHEACRNILRDTAEAVEAAAQNTAEPKGTLRITAPIDYGATVVAPVAVALRKQYPELAIELLAGDRFFDLAAEGIDLAIRVGKLTDSTYQAVRVGSFADWLVASPELLRAYPQPRHPSDLVRFPFVALSVLPNPLSWTYSKPGEESCHVRFSSSMSTNTAFSLRCAVLAGGGMAMLPDFAVSEDIATGRLLRVLPDWGAPSGGIHAVFPASKHRPRKTRVFIEALRRHVDTAWQAQA